MGEQRSAGGKANKLLTAVGNMFTDHRHAAGRRLPFKRGFFPSSPKRCFGFHGVVSVCFEARGCFGVFSVGMVDVTLEAGYMSGELH